MKADRVMTVDVTCVDRETPLLFAWELMRELKVRHMPVVENGKLLGILSDRDLLMRGTRNVKGTLDFPDLCAAEAMSLHPWTCPPDATVGRVARMMVDHRIDSVPITGPDGELIGLVTSTDLLGLLAEPETAPRVIPFDFKVNLHPGLRHTG